MAILLAFELLVARDDEVWTRDPRSKTGLHAILTESVVPQYRDAIIVFLGDSCVRDAFDPVQIETELGLDRGAVLNLAVTGGTPFDCEKIWQAARAELERPRVVILGLEDHHFGPRRPTDVERQLATLEERISDFRSETRNRLLVGTLWRTFATREVLERQFLNTWRGADRSLPIGTDGRVVWRPEDEVREHGPQEHDPEPRVTELFGPMHEFARQSGSATDPLATRPIERLIERILRDPEPIELVILRLPRRPSFEAATKQQFPAEFKAARRALRDLAQAFPAARVVDSASRDATSLALQNIDFYDWGHATLSGARRLGSWAAHAVRRLVPELDLRHDASTEFPLRVQPSPPK